MRLHPVLVTPFLAAALCFCAFPQTPDAKDTQPSEIKGMPPRATAADYQAQGQAGAITIAAEFSGHSVPRPDGPLSTEDYVVVETGFFGPQSDRIKLSIDDFSLRINGKKNALPSQPYGLVAHSLKDPSWVAPEEAEGKPKSKGGLSTGGNKGDSDSLPVVIHIPIALQRSMAQYIQKSSLPQGERPLPAAGLLFFEYRGKTQNLRSIELIYNGPAGKATLSLNP